MSTSLALVSVPFQGNQLDAVRDGRGVWISIRRVCDALGIATQGQLEKLKDKPWATVTLIVTQVAGNEQHRQISCVDLDALPMWLATIEPSRVAPEVAPKLIAYQREAARVLREHFFPRPSDAPPATVADRLLLEVSQACAQGQTKLAVALTKALVVAVAGKTTRVPRPRSPELQDGLLERITVHLAGLDQTKGVTAEDVLTALGLPVTTHGQMRICKVMRQLGWQKGRQQRRGSFRIRPFFPPGAAHPSLDDAWFTEPPKKRSHDPA